MLLSPKWQTMWLESQHCSKSIMSGPLPSQQAKKVLEDLRNSCCSPNKLVQLEALKCWGLWIHSQNSDDWKLNTVCFTAVRPLITKKMQPLHRDVDVCKLKLSLMWALLVKVENLMHLEGPQYILEVFLQSCLSWMSSVNGDGCENEVSHLIFQLLLSVLKKSETVNGCDKDAFNPLTTDILYGKKVFYRLADKFLNIVTHWRKVPDKSMFFKLWKHFLEHCELSCEHIPIPLWHKVFKLADQICSEKNEPIKERLAFLHSCATTLNVSLSSSKFIDFGNLLTTPCEALFKKLVELCTTKCTEFCDSEMFLYSKEISQTLSDKSVSISGFDLCIHVLELLEEFSLKELLWGVWCGLVHCYKIHLQHLDRSQFTEVQMKFYRKLRGVAVNFELDRNALHKDCITEVEKHIRVLNINCFCAFQSEIAKTRQQSSPRGKELAVEPMEVDSPGQSLSVPDRIVRKPPPNGNFSTVALYRRTKTVPRIDNLKIDLIKHILANIDANCKKSLFNYLLSFQYSKATQPICRLPASLSLQLKVYNKEQVNLTLSCLRPKVSSPAPPSTLVKRNAVVLYERHRKVETDEEEEEEEETISTPKTRSRKRAEEEMKKEVENQKRKKRKSFEVLVQEIVRKNKERKTEKNSKRKSPVLLKGKKNKKKEKKGAKKNKIVGSDQKPEICDRKLRHVKKEEVKVDKKKGKKSFKTDGKLENYFKVITKKSGSEVKKDEKTPRKGKKEKAVKKESSCCNTEKEESGERKGEIGWRQTSLKMMMNRKTKTEKSKPESRSRNKSVEATEEKAKARKGSKVTDSPLSKLSPFKEVFHDHEYAKIELEQLQTFERVLLVKQERVSEVNAIKKPEKPSGGETASVKAEKATKREPEPVVLFSQKVTESPKTEAKNLEIRKPEQSELGGKENSRIGEVEVSEDLNCTHAEPKKPNFQVEKPSVEMELSNPDTEINPIQCEKDVNTDANKPDVLPPDVPIPEYQPKNDVITWEETPEEVSADATPIRRGRKRVRMLDSVKPSKKMKLQEEDPVEEKLPLEVTEKENLEEKQPKMSSPTKKEKAEGYSLGRSEDSPKTVNGIISSRALRMIALVPESTKGSQMQWESTPRTDALKCKKAPNVDKNSRASKMLALLTENVTELDEMDVKMEEITSRKGASPLPNTPTVKTPVSSLKSPRSMKKRRSIRFDDAKNETVLYKTDTPPSQILEEKEKCRRFKPAEL